MIRNSPREGKSARSDSMLKVAFIGAGSVVFAKRLVTDILHYPSLRECTLSFMDIDEKRLRMITKWTARLVEQEGLPARIESTMDRRQALKGADFVILMIQVGGLKPFEVDVSVPLRYGVDQSVGDTLGPGGVFRALRTIPVLLDICDDMSKLCPKALLINYVNPMAMNCWAMNKHGKIKSVGLCHSVQGTARQVAGYMDIDFDDVSYWCAGINHMAWYLKYEYKGKDAYPLLWKAMKKPKVFAKDRVRFEMMKHLGYFITESSWHLSEYCPYFRRAKKTIKKFEAPTGWYLDICKRGWQKHYKDIQDQIDGKKPIVMDSSQEYGSHIMNAMVTGERFRFNGNVPNTGLITNLPQGSTVEVPIYADKTGIHPSYVGDLPPQLAAMNRTNINVQELAVEAAITGDRRLAFQAVMMDPLTAAVCDIWDIRKMVDEMLKKQKKWLPQFS